MGKQVDFKQLSCKAGVAKQWAMDQYWSGPVRKQAAQQGVSLNVMRLTHPATIPTPQPHSMEKLSAMNPVPDAKKVGDC